MRFVLKYDEMRTKTGDPNGVAEEDSYKQTQGVDGGNPICEPVYVMGAEVGDTLQVSLN